MGLGEVYEDKGLYKEAIDEYRRVIELDARHTGALYNLALVFEKADPQEAIARPSSPHSSRRRRTGWTSPGSTSASSGASSRSSEQRLELRLVEADHD